MPARPLQLQEKGALETPAPPTPLLVPLWCVFCHPLSLLLSLFSGVTGLKDLAKSTLGGIRSAQSLKLSLPLQAS